SVFAILEDLLGQLGEIGIGVIRVDGQLQFLGQRSDGLDRTMTVLGIPGSEDEVGSGEWGRPLFGLFEQLVQLVGTLLADGAEVDRVIGRLLRVANDQDPLRQRRALFLGPPDRNRIEQEGNHQPQYAQAQTSARWHCWSFLRREYAAS